MVTQTKEYSRAYRANNLDRVRAHARKWARNNKDKVNEIRTRCRLRNPAWHSAQSAEYRARKLRAMPHWLDKEQRGQIRDYYECAQLLDLTVDHIVPLKGKTVCGLHAPWNLQILSQTENCSKHNTLEENDYVAG